MSREFLAFFGVGFCFSGAIARKSHLRPAIAIWAIGNCDRATRGEGDEGGVGMRCDCEK